jgi:hypothetical protein
LLVSGVLNLLGALLVLFAMDPSEDARVAQGWALVQFISGVWAGVLGANSPFLHGIVAGIPSMLLGIAIASPLPLQFVIVAWAIAAAAALIAAAIMRFMRRRGP